MIFGAHVIVYSSDAQADRRFFQDVLGFAPVDAGDGWLIFGLPPAEPRSIRAVGKTDTISISCVTTSTPKWRFSNRRASSPRQSKNSGGGSRPEFDCRAAGTSACTNRNTLRRCAAFQADERRPRRSLPLPEDLPRRLDVSEPRSVAVSGDLENCRNRVEERMAEQPTKCLCSDLAIAEIFVAVAIRAKRNLRVVQMNAEQSFEAEDLVESAHRLIRVLTILVADAGQRTGAGCQDRNRDARRSLRIPRSARAPRSCDRSCPRRRRRSRSTTDRAAANSMPTRRRTLRRGTSRPGRSRRRCRHRGGFRRGGRGRRSRSRTRRRGSRRAPAASARGAPHRSRARLMR